MSVVVAVAAARVWLSLPSAVPPHQVAASVALPWRRVAVESEVAVFDGSVKVTVHVAPTVEEARAAPPFDT